ncbi:uncharacterized protein LOC119732407 isoform X2 [Patiria miniata]|nr:uncharacterized protein LOC119732407 isoform X2 [Patiria miniata]
MIYDETIKLRQNISQLADELQIIDHEGLETGRITQLRNIPYPTELPECHSQEEFGELMESVQARLADSIQALKALKVDMHTELELEREFYNFESEANQLRDAIHCYLYRTSVWDLPAYTSYRMIDSQFDLPSYHTVEEMHFRNKHFANELHKYLRKTHESALSCYGHRSKRERATWIERELEKRAREILQSQLEPDAVELVSKRGWAPTWEDDLALGGEAYLPETKRDWAPNWEDDLALGGEAYLPETKRDWAPNWEDDLALGGEAYLPETKRDWAPNWEDDLALGGEAYLPETKREWAPNREDDLALGGEAYLPETKRDWAPNWEDDLVLGGEAYLPETKRDWAPNWEDDLALGGEAYLPETKRDWAPTWEDDLALGGEAYLPKTKRDWATSYRFEDNVADQDQERLDQALTPQDTPQEVRYSQEDLEMAWHLLFGPVEEPKKRSAHASSWLANL